MQSEAVLMSILDSYNFMKQNPGILLDERYQIFPYPVKVSFYKEGNMIKF